jgi:hypothetical protein
MLERYEEAIQIYQRLVDLGIDELSAGECSEGRARGRGLHADALYRLGLSRAKKQPGSGSEGGVRTQPRRTRTGLSINLPPR